MYLWIKPLGAKGNPSPLVMLPSFMSSFSWLWRVKLRVIFVPNLGPLVGVIPLFFLHRLPIPTGIGLRGVDIEITNHAVMAETAKLGAGDFNRALDIVGLGHGSFFNFPLI